MFHSRYTRTSLKIHVFYSINVGGRVEANTSLTRRRWTQSHDPAADDLTEEDFSSYHLPGHANIADRLTSFAGYHTWAQPYHDEASAHEAGPTTSDSS